MRNSKFQKTTGTLQISFNNVHTALLAERHGIEHSSERTLFLRSHDAVAKYGFNCSVLFVQFSYAFRDLIYGRRSC